MEPPFGRVSLNAMLQQSSVDGNLQQMELLLACGAHVHIRDRSERTPVHLAAINDHDESIRKLLDSDAALEPLDQQGQVSPAQRSDSTLFETAPAMTLQPSCH
jgi:ankyrin repeat protein